MFSASLYIPESALDNAGAQIFGRPLEGIALSHLSMLELGDGTARSQEQKYWTLRWFFTTLPALDDITALLNDAHPHINIQNDDWVIDDIPDDTNWLERVHTQNPPITAAPFFIYGSHYAGNIPPDHIALNIDAITAFGSGDHGTTKGCLLAMAALKQSGVCPWNILDMGTGSGILAIAAWKLWKTPVLGIDIEDESITVCARHAAQNNAPIAAHDLTFECGDGFAAPLVRRKKPFDLIIANILAAPLQTMAHDMFKFADDMAYIILSGILNTQVHDVIDTYAGAGFKHANTNEIGEWSTIVMRKP